MSSRSTAGVANELGLAASTLRRWIDGGLVDTDATGAVTERGVAQARVIRRLRARGYSLKQIADASERGMLASSHLEALPDSGLRWSIKKAAREVGVNRKLAAQLLTAAGVSIGEDEEIGELELELLRAVATVLERGVPLPVVLQLARVYGQAVSQVADAEVRLIHHHVHEPLMRSGMSGRDVVDQIQSLASEVLPLTSPVLGLMHQYYLRVFTEQDVIGHMEELAAGAGGGEQPKERDELTRVRVAVAFADLAGYTRLTEDLGDARAVDTVERFVASIASSLPSEARVTKTIGDEAMIVSPDIPALVRWAVSFQAQEIEPSARIGLHCGQALFYEGDYYGREVNLASRVAARAAAGEVVVTGTVAELKPPGVSFDRLGEIKLRGFSSPTEIFLAVPRASEDKTRG